MEETLVKVLSALFGGRVFPDVAEIGTPVPFCVFRQIGGTPVNSLDGVPVGRKNALVEIVVVSRTRKETMELKRNQETLLLTIGCTDSLNIAVFTPLYDSLLGENSSLDLNIQSSHHSSELYGLLSEHNIDIGFVYHKLHYKNIITRSPC